MEPFLLCAATGDHGAAAPRIEPFAGRPDEFLLFAKGFDRFHLSYTDPAVLAELSTFVARIDPDVVHIQHYLDIGIDFIGAVRRLNPKVRIVVTLHEYLAICHHYGMLIKTDGFTLCTSPSDSACAACFAGIGTNDFARRRIRLGHYLGQVDLFIAPSKFLRRRYIEWGLPARSIAVLENGIEPAARGPGETRRTPRRTFGFFGQIHPFKGLPCLLAAFEQLAGLSDGPPDGLRLVINGAYLEFNPPDFVAGFRRSLDRLEEIVEFAGPYPHGDLGERMAAVDWVILPSIWWENSPVVIQEAFAYRRPVLCSDIGGMREKVRPGKDGFHFPVGDAAALAALVLKVSKDAEVWDRLQETIRRPMTIADSVVRHLAYYRHPPVG